MTFNEIKQITKIPPAIKFNWFKQGDFCGYTTGNLETLAIRVELTKKGIIKDYTTKIDESFYYLFDKEDDIESFEVAYDKFGCIEKWFPEYEFNDNYINVNSEALDYAIQLANFYKQN